MPFKTALTFTYDSGEFEKNMDMALALADAKGFAARRAESKKRGRLRGFGLSNTIERAGAPSFEGAEIRFDRAGDATLFSGSVTQGQGHETVFKQLVCDRLGLDPAETQYLQGDTDLVTLVWHLVIAGQTPTNLIANSVAALLSHPAQLHRLRADPSLMPGAVEELIRWCGPTLLSIPRYAREDVEMCGVLIAKGEAVTASVAAVNRDPRVFTEPDRFDIGRTDSTGSHLGFGHGAHFCLGASPARVQTEVALTALLRRYHEFTLAVDDPAALRVPDPGTWRLSSLPVLL